MDQKFFRVPFARDGNQTAVPDTTQPDGSISYTDGWGPDYQRDPETDPQFKEIDRQQTNGMFFEVTNALRQYQTKGFPEWITSDNNGGVPFVYDKAAFVNYRATEAAPWALYVSLVDANVVTPGTDGAKWQLVPFAISSTAQALAGVDDTTTITPLKLRQAIDDAFATRLPVRFTPAQIVWSAGDNPLTGTMAMNGAAISRTVYANLFAIIGTKYGVGNGTTTFNLPNILDGQTVVSTGGALSGASTNGQVISHSHTASASADGNHNHPVQTGANGFWVDQPGRYIVGVEGSIAYLNLAPTTADAGTHTHPVTVNAAGGSANLPAGVKMTPCIAF